MALLYIGRLLSKGKMRFSTSRHEKTNEYFGNKLGRRDNVGEIYKLTKFGADRLRNGASTWWWMKYNGFVTFFVRLILFFRFLGQPTGRNFGPNCTLNGSKVVFWGAFKFTMRGSSVQKTATCWSVKVLTSPISCTNLLLTLEPWE